MVLLLKTSVFLSVLICAHSTMNLLWNYYPAWCYYISRHLSVITTAGPSVKRIQPHHNASVWSHLRTVNTPLTLNQWLSELANKTLKTINSCQQHKEWRCLDSQTPRPSILRDEMVTDASFCQIDCAFVSCWCVLQYWSVIAEGVVNVVDVTTFLTFEPLPFFSVFNWMLMIFNFLHKISPKFGLFDSKYCLKTGVFGSSNKPVSADQHGLRWEKRNICQFASLRPLNNKIPYRCRSLQHTDSIFSLCCNSQLWEFFFYGLLQFVMVILKQKCE